MLLKSLFAVPTGQKVTEKHLRRVLISSICSILLCMSCLAGVTWAWFSVSVENTGNVIQIGKPEVNLTVNDAAFKAGDALFSGAHKVSIEHANEVDDLQSKSTLYVTLTMDETTTVYTTLSHANGYKAEFTVTTEKACTLSWVASWFTPANAAELTHDTITLTAAESAEPSTETTTEPSTEAATEATAETASTDPSSAPTAGPEAAAGDAT